MCILEQTAARPTLGRKGPAGRLSEYATHSERAVWRFGLRRHAGFSVAFGPSLRPQSDLSFWWGRADARPDAGMDRCPSNCGCPSILKPGCPARKPTTPTGSVWVNGASATAGQGSVLSTAVSTHFLHSALICHPAVFKFGQTQISYWWIISEWEGHRPTAQRYL